MYGVLYGFTIMKDVTDNRIVVSKIINLICSHGNHLTLKVPSSH